MARRFRSARRRRASVAWIPGLTTYDTAAATAARARLVSLGVVSALVPDTWGAAIGMTTDTDLSLHGGEDAVIERIRGRLYFSDGAINSGAGLAASAFQLRVVLTKQNITPAGNVMPTDFTTADGMGDDTILWMKDVLVPSVVTSGAGTNIDTVNWEAFMLDVDVKAKRRLQSGNQLILWFQTVSESGGGATTAIQFVMRGGLRMLMKRPR